jgi:hypothetical protein
MAIGEGAGPHGLMITRKTNSLSRYRMKQKKNIFFLTMAVFFAANVFVTAVRAQDMRAAGSASSEITFITSGHSAPITFELSNLLWDDINAFHISYFITIGEGTLSVRIASAAAVGEYSNVIYAATGLLGTAPVFGYAYTGETLSLSTVMPEFGIGVLVTAIITTIGDPNFPVVMGMIVSLT